MNYEKFLMTVFCMITLCCLLLLKICQSEKQQQKQLSKLSDHNIFSLERNFDSSTRGGGPFLVFVYFSPFFLLLSVPSKMRVY